MVGPPGATAQPWSIAVGSPSDRQVSNSSVSARQAMLDVADRGGAEYQPKPRLVGVERRDDRSGGLGRIAWRQPVVVANVTPRWADDLFVLGHLGRLVGGVRAKKRPMCERSSKVTARDRGKRQRFWFGCSLPGLLSSL